MKGIKRYNKKFFDAIPEEPISIKHFDPETKKVAQKYREKLNKLLFRFGLKAEVKGSTSLEIEGVGDVDFRIAVPKKLWFEVLKYFINYYRRVEALDEEWARFFDLVDDTEIEIAFLRGHIARVDKKLSKYLKSHPEIWKGYVEIKRKYAYSRREYMRQKNKFFKSILSSIK